MTQTTNNTLVLVNVDGTYRDVDSGYEGIKDALEDRPFDYVRGDKHFGCYIDDEGMLLELPLNVPVSMMLGRAIYGPAVCCHGDPDDEGDTLPMGEIVREALIEGCESWRRVVATAQAVGQDPFAYANEATIPAPEIIELRPDQSIEDALREHGHVIITSLDEM